MESVRQNIIESATAVRGRPNPSQIETPTGRSSLVTPPPVHPISDVSRGSQLPTTSRTAATTLSSLPTGLDGSNGSTASAQPREMHLLVCVGGREFETLATVRHLDITTEWNDGMLLRALLREYEEARQGRQWSISSLLPVLPAGIRKSPFVNSMRRYRMPSWIRDAPMWEWWHSWIPDGGLCAPLHMPSTADFVKVSSFYDSDVDDMRC